MNYFYVEEMVINLLYLAYIFTLENKVDVQREAIEETQLQKEELLTHLLEIEEFDEEEHTQGNES
eukprot:CAMPEP_0202978708 /NCGR_PEP_ID=MMETSP1396-20130829/85053_1 /ASSEMBLY_ACC=CAM_ASM_000872 /TAXON_ID= /ORGANISM="Pseudokeronopsis sp., Strain Brazil" /LENGTH=64 /DNA_ID=CAMNT_0049717793 /DNA_START=1065 /DNA_END=1259 /DNA_ORIENTATION=-